MPVRLDVGCPGHPPDLRDRGRPVLGGDGVDGELGGRGRQVDGRTVVEQPDVVAVLDQELGQVRADRVGDEGSGGHGEPGGEQHRPLLPAPVADQAQPAVGAHLGALVPATALAAPANLGLRQAQRPPPGAGRPVGRGGGEAPGLVQRAAVDPPQVPGEQLQGGQLVLPAAAGVGDTAHLDRPRRPDPPGQAKRPQRAAPRGPGTARPECPPVVRAQRQVEGGRVGPRVEPRMIVQYLEALEDVASTVVGDEQQTVPRVPGLDPIGVGFAEDALAVLDRQRRARQDRHPHASRRAARRALVTQQRIGVVEVDREIDADRRPRGVTPGESGLEVVGHPGREITSQPLTETQCRQVTGRK